MLLLKNENLYLKPCVDAEDTVRSWMQLLIQFSMFQQYYRFVPFGMFRFRCLQSFAKHLVQIYEIE